MVSYLTKRKYCEESGIPETTIKGWIDRLWIIQQELDLTANTSKSVTNTKASVILSQSPKSPTRPTTKIRQQRLDRLRLGLGDSEQQAPCFHQLAKSYLDTLDASYSTLLSYRNALNKYWIPALAKLPITAIHFRDLKKVDNKIKWPSGKSCLC